MVRCVKDNQGVYLQLVPSKLPPWPVARRLVAPLPFQLPDPSPSVTPEVAAALIAVAAGREVPSLITEKAPFEATAAAAAGERDYTASTNTAAAAVASATAAALVSNDATAAGGSSSSHSSSSGCSFCRCLVCALVYPLLLLVSLVGCVVWLVLLPFKVCCCCCCPVAMVLQLTWDVVEWGVKAPLRGALWAAGQEWRPQKGAAGPVAAGAEGGGEGRQKEVGKGQGDIEAPA